MYLIQALTMIREQCQAKDVEVGRAIQEVVLLEQIRAEIRDRVRYLTQRMREEQNRITTEQMEEMPMFDRTQGLDWLPDWQAINRVTSSYRRYRNYLDDLEPLFQNDVLGRMIAQPNGSRWVASHLGIPHSTARRWHRMHAMDSGWPWHDPRKGTFTKFSREDCELLREAFMRDPRMTHKEVAAPQILQMLQEIWVREHPRREFPMMCLDTVRRMPDRWGN
jgi:hypothetical protein